MLLIQDLIADLKYELTGKFERLIVSLMKPPAYHDAKEIKDAIKVRQRVNGTESEIRQQLYQLRELGRVSACWACQGLACVWAEMTERND